MNGNMSYLRNIRAAHVWHTAKSRMTFYRLWSVLALLVKILFLVTVCFTILYPLIVKFSTMFMSERDLLDNTVKLVPKSPTLDNLRYVLKKTEYGSALLNTVFISAVSGICCVFSSCMIGWGLARFKFRGRGLVMAIVVLITILPPQTIMLGLYTQFRDFDVFGLIRFLAGHPIRLSDSIFPMIILSSTGLVFRGGLFILVMRQFYTGLPKELVEAAKIDGYGNVSIFLRIVIPLSTAMMVTIFLFSFAWMWSDTIYSGLFYSNTALFANRVSAITYIPGDGIFYNTRLSGVMLNTSLLLSMLPLLIIYLFSQRFFVEGIERSGIVG